MIKTVFLPIVSIILAGTLVGMGVNAVRVKDRIRINRVYFPPSLEAEHPGVGSSSDQPARPSDQGGSVVTDLQMADNESRPGDEDKSAEQPPQHPYHTIDLEEAKQLFETSQELPGYILFIDGRKDEEYEAGHIPGAAQADFYNLELCIDEVLKEIEIAHQVVVYCNGGDCEDSLLLCNELCQTYFVSEDKIHLFEGGLKEWKAHELPIEKGPRPERDF